VSGRPGPADGPGPEPGGASLDLALDIDDAGRFVVRLRQGDASAVVTASNLDAADDLLAAIEDARDTGLGECVWEEPGGDYRWMLRHDDGELIVVALWSAGTLTGWEHVFRGRCGLDWLADRVRAELARHGLEG
jgi:hypothetical protein